MLGATQRAVSVMASSVSRLVGLHVFYVVGIGATSSFHSLVVPNTFRGGMMWMAVPRGMSTTPHDSG